MKETIGQPSRHRYGEIINLLQDLAEELRTDLRKACEAGSSTREQQKIKKSEIRLLEGWIRALLKEGSERGTDEKGSVAGEYIASEMNVQLSELRGLVRQSGK